MFASDEPLAALLRESTALKDAGRWPDAVASLYQVKALMLVSPVSYPVETWCKLPLYLQQAGLFAEAMAEFQFLLDDLPRRARQEARLDEPCTSPIASASNQRLHKSLLINDAELIQAKRALAQKRETKRRPTAVEKALGVNKYNVTAEEVFAGVYAWFQANPWFTKIDIKVADLTQEPAAQQAVLSLHGAQDVFRGLSPGVQGLAARFVYMFMAELRGPMLKRVWIVSLPEGAPHDPVQLAWLAIEQEIALTNPLPSKPH